MTTTIHHGNVTEWARAYTGPKFHAVFCDPPYLLKFMGRAWDSGDVSINPDTWSAIASVCKPGAMLLAFGGTRTFHRIAVAIEDAGWEIRDTVMWVYGQGFPKSHDVSKAIDREAGAQREVVGRKGGRYEYGFTDAARNHFRGMGGSGFTGDASAIGNITAPATAAAAQWSGYGTALKPAYEPVIVARLPLDGTVAQTAQTHGTGALAIDACRVGNFQNTTPSGVDRRNAKLAQMGYRPNEYQMGEKAPSSPPGRFPANLIHDGSDEVLTLFPETAGDSSGRKPRTNRLDSWREMEGRSDRPFETATRGFTDTGSAARFFYCAKASTSERNAGCDALPLVAGKRTQDGGDDTRGRPLPENRNIHPTVKPLALTEYLARLILPPELDEPRRLFVPFAGSGSEAIGARRAGWDVVEGVELEAAHVDIARARVAHWEAV